MPVIKFKDKNKDFVCHVKQEFLTLCPNAETLNSQTLITENKLIQYLHNTEGPAVIAYNKKGEFLQQEFFIDGKFIPEAEAKKIIHNNEFNNKFNEEMK